MTPARRLVGELLGTALLLAAVVGSGIMGERLSGGNVAIALLAFALAGAVLDQTGAGRRCASQREGGFTWQIRSGC